MFDVAMSGAAGISDGTMSSRQCQGQREGKGEAVERSPGAFRLFWPPRWPSLSLVPFNRAKKVLGPSKSLDFGAGTILNP